MRILNDFSYICSTVLYFQLSVFLNRLTSQPIGLTAMGLFVLDKPTIITVGIMPFCKHVMSKVILVPCSVYETVKMGQCWSWGGDNEQSGQCKDVELQRL